MTGTHAWLVSLSRVGDGPQVHEQIPDPTIREWDGGASRGHTTMGVTEEGFRVRAEGARKGQNQAQFAREEARSVHGGRSVCREEAGGGRAARSREHGGRKQGGGIRDGHQVESAGLGPDMEQERKDETEPSPGCFGYMPARG